MLIRKNDLVYSFPERYDLSMMAKRITPGAYTIYLKRLFFANLFVEGKTAKHEKKRHGRNEAEISSGIWTNRDFHVPSYIEESLPIEQTTMNATLIR